MAHTRLPPNISPRLRAIMEPKLAPDGERLAAVASVISALRQEAKDARKASGIEETWLACEEAYVGIDAANRHEFGHSRWTKPLSPDGPLTRNILPPTDGRSNIFIPITARYVDAGTSKLTEILLPMDDKAFSFSETPLPDTIELKKSDKQVVSPELGPLTRDARKGELPPPNPAAGQQPPPPQGGPPPAAAMPGPAGPPAGPAAPPGMPGMPPGMPGVPGAPPGMPGAEPPLPPQVPLTAKDLAEEQIQLAREKAKKAETRIYDWMVESCYTAEARKVIFDSARLGVGVLKGPFPMAKREVVASKTDAGIEVLVRSKTFPGTRWVDAWNFFPDPSCGENVHDGGHCFERDFFSEFQVRKLLDEPGYIAAEIGKVIEEGPGGIKDDDNDKPNKLSEEQRKNQYEIWYFHGVLSRDDYWCVCHAAGQPTESSALAPQVFAIVTMINDHVVKAAFNPLELSGELPYHAVPWRRRPGHWAGIGVAEQVSPAQRITNGAMRAMLNNAGKSAGTQIVINRDAINPADGRWQVTPDKIWELQSDMNMTVDQAFGMFTIPNTTGPLNEIVQIGMRMAEESTNIPLVTQGQSGPTQPETLGGMQLQNNNANQLLRQVGTAYDDYVTEPVIRQYYEYLLLDPDVPEDEKGDFAINAHGSAALVERSIQDQMLNQMLMVAKDPAYGLSPRKTMKEFLKSKRFDPRLLENSEEEQAALDQQPPPAPPAIEVAKIRQQTDAERIGIDKERVKLEREDMLTDRSVALQEIAMRREIAMMEYANAKQMTLDQVKAKLAETAMKLDVQQRMSADKTVQQGGGKGGGGGGRNGRVPNSRVPQIVSAPTEPAGTAPNGRGFEQ